jgi:membrane-bound serine protease (ClpP class)
MMRVSREIGRSAVLSVLLLLGSALMLSASASDVHVIRVHGVINPISSDHIEKGIRRAETDSAEALVIELDTPGGLMKSVHEISKSILNAGVPVVVYVWPEGSRATSAGVLVTISAHVAAMAPGTHIGAAHVVELQGSIQDSVVNEKATNDWVAELQSVAKLRGRNVEWVELAARESKSLIAEDAVEQNVVDMMAANLDSLLARIDGRAVVVQGRQDTLRTANPTVRTFGLSARQRFLNVITDPSIAYILFLVGIYGLIFELSNPGSLVPGVVGGICIILALVAFHSLPINYAGLALIILAIVLFIAEVKITSYGLLTVGGIAAMTLGSIMLLERAGPLFKISLAVIIPAVLCTLGFFAFAVSKGILAQKRHAVTGSEGLVGEVGVVHKDLSPSGKVFLHGEYWNATSRTPIPKGGRVKVVRVQGMMLIVDRADDDASGAST